MVTISCVLFVNMGLSEAIQNLLHLKLRILSCPKCLTMWTCLAIFLLHRYDLVESIAVSFICSYLSLWLTLIYDGLSALYNNMYELFTETDTAKDNPPAETPAGTGGPDAVS